MPHSAEQVPEVIHFQTSPVVANWRYDIIVEMLAAQAHAEIERLAFEARKTINHRFGALIAWNRRCFQRKG